MITDFYVWEQKLSLLLASKKIAGMAVALTDRNGVIWEKGFGVTSVEKPWDKMSAKTLSRVASNTKFTVGLCAMQLVDQGKMNLDSPLAEYLPWFFVGNADITSRITVRKLLNHTAGFPSEYTPDGFRDEDRAEKVLREQISRVKLITDPDDNIFHYSKQYTLLEYASLQLHVVIYV